MSEPSAEGAEWYLAVGGEQQGPISEESLKESIRDGRLGPETMVWKQGMADWTQLQELALYGQALSPPSDQEEAPDPRDLGRGPVATLQPSLPDPWRRYLARNFDLLSFQFALLQLHAQLFPEQRVKLVAFLIGSHLLWALIEAVLLSSVGFTPGKWLMHVEVTDSRGRRLRIVRSLRRAFDVSIRGTALGMQFIDVFAKVLGLYQLTGTGITHWDRDARCVVTHRPLELWRWMAMLALTLLLINEREAWQVLVR